MEIRCMNCVTKKLEKCILISRLHDIKCTHNGGDIFLKDKLSLLRISIHFIFVTTLLLKLIEGVNRLWKEKVIMSSKFWEEFSYTFASFLQLLIWTAILTVEKEIFKLVFGGTDLTMFAEKCRIKILKEYDIKVINKFQKGALFFIILNPIYVSTWIDYVFCNRKSILNQICEIWAVYMISCLGFYAEIGYLIHKLIWYNLFKILKISLLKYKGTVAFDNKIKIIKTMVSKLRHHFNIMENILTPPSIVIVSLIPVIVMNIFTKFFLEMQSEELTINLCGINLLLACGYATVLYFNLLISMENCQKPREKILSFLFKYQFTKLNRLEAEKVEMLLRTIILQEPVVQANNMFTLDKPLIASMVAAIITHILCEIQVQNAFMTFY